MIAYRKALAAAESIENLFSVSDNLSILHPWNKAIGTDAGHICKRHIGLVLQEVAQEVEILPLQLLRLLSFTHHTVPFVDQKDELFVRSGVNFLKCFRKNNCLL